MRAKKPFSYTSPPALAGPTKGNHPHPHRLRPLRQPRIERRQRVVPSAAVARVERVGGAQARRWHLAISGGGLCRLLLPAKRIARPC